MIQLKNLKDKCIVVWLTLHNIAHPQPYSGSISLQSKNRSLAASKQTHFDSFRDALHTAGPKMKAPANVLAAGAFITLEDN